MLKITLPDGSIREYEGAVTPLQVAQSISDGLARNTISAIVNGQQTEVETTITEDSTVQLLTWNDDMGKKAFWHSSAHLLAQAIMEFYPNAKLTIGPAIANGFYYDVDFGGEPLSEKDFEKLKTSGKMFCRKVQTGTSDKLITMIDNYRKHNENK